MAPNTIHMTCNIKSCIKIKRNPVVVGWLQPAATCSLPLTKPWDERENRKNGSDKSPKDSLIHGEKNKRCKGYPSPSPTETSAQPVSEQWPPRKPKHLFFLLHLCSYCWIWCCMVWTIPVTTLGQLSRLSPLPASCLSPAYWLGVQSEKQRRSWCCVSSAQQQLKSWCVVSYPLDTSPEHRTI